MRLQLTLSLFRQLLAKLLQRSPPLIRDRRVTVARFAIPVRAALRAEPEALLIAQRFHRDRELNLRDCQLAQRARPLRIELDVELDFGDIDLFVLLGSLRTSAVSYVNA